MTATKRPSSVGEAIAALRAIDPQKCTRLLELVERWRASEFPPDNAETLGLCLSHLEAAERLEAFIERKQIASWCDHARFDDDGAPPRRAQEFTESQYRALVAGAFAAQKNVRSDL